MSNNNEWKPAGWPEGKPWPAEWNPADEHLIKPLEIALDKADFIHDEAIVAIYDDFVQAHMEQQRDAVCVGRRKPEDVPREDVAQDFYDREIQKAVHKLDDIYYQDCSPENMAQGWERIAALYAFAIMEKLEAGYPYCSPDPRPPYAR